MGCAGRRIAVTALRQEGPLRLGVFNPVATGYAAVASVRGVMVGMSTRRVPCV